MSNPLAGIATPASALDGIAVPASAPKGQGTFYHPFDLSGGQSRGSIPRGTYYLDPQRNIRRNDNGDTGNPIITQFDSPTPPPVSTPELRRGVRALATPGPTQRFLSAPRKDKPVQDSAVSLFAGLGQSTLNGADQLFQSWGPIRILDTAADTTDALAGLVQAARGDKPQPMRPAPPQGPREYLFGMPITGPAPPSILPLIDKAISPDQPFVDPVMSYEAQTAPGRYAQAAGQAAPYVASMPGAAVPILGQALASQGVRDVVAANGGSEQLQSFAGDTTGLLVGGLLSAKPRLSVPTIRPSAQAAIDAAPRLPEGVAPKDYARAADYAARLTKSAGATPEAIAKAPETFTTAEAIGKPGKAGLGALGIREGQTGPKLEGMIQGRQIGRADRILGGVADVAGVAPEAAQGSIDALLQSGRAKAGPMFDAARANTEPVMTDRLAQIAQTPAGKAALRKAATDILNNPDGAPPEAQGFQITGVTPEGLPDGVTLKAPTIETWDKVYKALSAQVERNPFTGKPLPDSLSDGNYRLNLVRSALRAELGKASPEWDQAMKAAGEYKPSEADFNDASRMLFNGNVTEAQFAKRFETVSPAAKAGLANRFYDLAQTGRLKPSVLATPRVQAKLTTILGPEGFSRLLDLTSRENQMLQFERRYGPDTGSPTAERLTAISEQDAGSPLLGHISDALEAGIRHGKSGVVANVVGKAAKGIGAAVRTRGMAQGVRDAAGDILMLPPQEGARVIAARQAMKNAPRLPRLSLGYPSPSGIAAPALIGAAPRISN